MKRSAEEVLLSGDSGKAIENQEKRGQQDLQYYEVFPIDMGEHKEDFEQLGFQFGEAVDELFYNCDMPEGWKKVPTGHSMWTDLVDDKGRVRGSIFYKAAFYDRRATAHLNRRFTTSVQPIGGYEQENYREKPHYAVVLDMGKIVWESESFDRSDYATSDARGKEARAWLNSNYPEWENPTQYWD